MSNLRPEKQYSEPDIRVKDLIEFGKELIDKGVSEKTRTKFARLAVKPPMVRLAINQRSLITCLSGTNNYRDVLMAGLTEEERQALVELDLRGVSLRSREIAHGLLNVHERWMVARRIGPVFQRARSRRHAYVNLHQMFEPEDFDGVDHEP